MGADNAEVALIETQEVVATVAFGKHDTRGIGPPRRSHLLPLNY